ncbi:MAG: group I truncated hemoglobin [Gammaproteobacteria bacterium]
MTRPTKSLAATLLVTLLAVVGCGEDKAPTPTAGAPAPAAPQKAPAASSQNLFERLGGQEGIEAVVDALLANIGADSRIKHYFNNLNQVRFKANNVAFLCEKTGGPCSYTGVEIKRVHKSLQVTSEDFDAMMETIGKTLDEKGVAEADKKELTDLMASYKADIVSSVSP